MVCELYLNKARIKLKKKKKHPEVQEEMTKTRQNERSDLHRNTGILLDNHMSIILKRVFYSMRIIKLT